MPSISCRVCKRQVLFGESFYEVENAKSIWEVIHQFCFETLDEIVEI